MPVDGRAEHDGVGLLEAGQHLIELVVVEVLPVVVDLVVCEIYLVEIKTGEEPLPKGGGVPALLAPLMKRMLMSLTP